MFGSMEATGSLNWRWETRDYVLQAMSLLLRWRWRKSRTSSSRVLLVGGGGGGGGAETPGVLECSIKMHFLF